MLFSQFCNNSFEEMGVSVGIVNIVILCQFWLIFPPQFEAVARGLWQFVGEGHYPFAVIFALLKKEEKKERKKGEGGERKKIPSGGGRDLCVCVHCLLGWELGYKKADWNTGKQKIWRLVCFYILCS